jgi:small subunit ribosomal protein S13
VARIAGVDIPPKKHLEIGLTYIYGIGRTRAKEIVKKADLSPAMRVSDLTDEQVSRLNGILESDYVVEGGLRRQLQDNIQRLGTTGSWRGARHRLGLPVRGQRTRSNARTRKGPRRTVAGRKKAPTPK